MAALETRRDLPQEIRTRETVWILMRDGCRLAAEFWLPTGAHSDPVPAILENTFPTAAETLAASATRPTTATSWPTVMPV